MIRDENKVPVSQAFSHDLRGGGSESAVFRTALKEIAFGSIAGMVSEIFEYPFDLAKVRLQAQLLTPMNDPHPSMRFRGPMDCLMQTWRLEGVRGLYRGLPAPIVGSMAETASLFVSYTTFQNLIRGASPIHRDTSMPLSISQLGLAAGGAGFVTSFILTPIELVKCKMQVQMINFPNSKHPPAPGRIPHRTLPSSLFASSGTLPRPHLTSTTSHSNNKKNSNTPSRLSLHDIAYRAKAPVSVASLGPPGPIALIRSIVDTHGLAGLWLGHTGTLLRETGGSAAWFVVKEWVARILVERRSQREQLLTLSSGSSSFSNGVATTAGVAPLPWESAVSGAIAGGVGAIIMYPADTVKSAIQTEEEMRMFANSANGRVSGSESPLGGDGVGTKNRPFWRTLVRMYRVHGLRGLYAGCGMTVARAVPSSGIIFVVYDGLNSRFG